MHPVNLICPLDVHYSESFETRPSLDILWPQLGSWALLMGILVGDLFLILVIATLREHGTYDTRHKMAIPPAIGEEESIMAWSRRNDPQGLPQGPQCHSHKSAELKPLLWSGPQLGEIHRWVTHIDCVIPQTARNNEYPFKFYLQCNESPFLKKKTLRLGSWSIKQHLLLPFSHRVTSFVFPVIFSTFRPL